jgi:AcrR family transcriptional regulator
MGMPATVPAPATRPGGRSARVQASVHRAAADLVRESGREQVTIPAVAARAGVNPTTIYRRWGDVARLLADVGVTELLATEPVPDTGALHEDLAIWAEALLARIGRPEKVEHLRHVVAALAAGEARGQCIADLRTQIAAILARAEARGEPAPAAGQVMDHVVAPLYFRVLFGIADPAAASPRTLAGELLG